MVIFFRHQSTEVKDILGNPLAEICTIEEAEMIPKHLLEIQLLGPTQLKLMTMTITSSLTKII